MRKMLLALVALLSVVGTGRADDAALVKRLEAEGVSVRRVGSWLSVSLYADNLDAALDELCELRGLGCVHLRHPGLTDNQLQRVCALGVKSLYFIDCPTTDARLKIVAVARGLETLVLFDTVITDAGLAELTRLSDLKTLYLVNASITDAGLRHLEGVKELRDLGLSRCPNITDDGVARLQKALPECKIAR
jgi:hypothetical protein